MTVKEIDINGSINAGALPTRATLTMVWMMFCSVVRIQYIQALNMSAVFVNFDECG